MILSIPHRHGTPRPVRPCGAVQLDEDFQLWIVAPWASDPSPDGPPGPTDSLWTHEVVELFVGSLDHPDGPYLEVEIGPFGHHLVLRLSSVRVREEALLPMIVQARRRDGWWAACARLDPAWLPPAPWRALACRVHGAGDDRAYETSATMPGERPDFHQPGAWAEVEPPRTFDPDVLIAMTGLAPTALRAASSAGGLPDDPVERLLHIASAASALSNG